MMGLVAMRSFVKRGKKKLFRVIRHYSRFCFMKIGFK